MPTQLPTPNTAALAHSQRLLDHISQQMQAQNDKITFASYMQTALYEPGLGYYSAGQQKFGEQGDFITAPEISPLFAYCLAHQCQQVLEQLPEGSILELGAGSGRLAADLLTRLDELNCLPHHYYILELSAELQQRQQALLQQQIPGYYDRIIWLNKLPAPNSFQGIILGNEVMDAMPVHLFTIDQGKTYERYVTLNDQQQLDWTLDNPSTPALEKPIQNIIENCLPGTEHYTSEVNLFLPGWIKSLADTLTTGLILLIDYGFPRHEYYHPQRNQGTLMCHFRHHAHPDPLLYPGLQDITAHVDFTSVAESAIQADLDLLGYTSQAHFLINCGLMELCTHFSSSDLAQQLQLSQQIKRLTLPQEMGELFKVIALGKELTMPLTGFAQHDQRHRL